MNELMKYDAEATRNLYRAIAKHDEIGLKEIRAYIRVHGGEIGNADFVDLEIRDGAVLQCQRHRLNINPDHWTASAGDMDASHAWDADGVWFPVREDK